MISRFFTAACLLLGVLLAGCAGDSDPADPSDTSDSSDYVFGFVTMTDEFANSVDDRSGADVVLRASDGRTFATKTNSDGGWRIDDLPAEVYTIRVSSPVYNARTESDSTWNMQYVGQGAFKVQDFRLAKMMSSAMYYDAKVEITWMKVRNHVDTTIIEDSIATISLTYSTRNETLASTDIVALAEHPSDDCSKSLATRGGVSVTQISASERSLNINPFFDVARSKYGASLIGRTVYVQIRPTAYTFDPLLARQVKQCINPVVVPITF